MDNNIVKRCINLIEIGNKFISQIPHSSDGHENYYFRKNLTKDIQSWLASAANIIFLIAKEKSYYYQECQRITTDEHLQDLVPCHVVQKLTGLLESLKNEIELGFFKQLEYIFTASAFDDFLDHAEQFHKSGKKTESSILVSVVFEDTIRKIAQKNNIEEAGVSIEQIIDNFVKENIFTPVKAKRAKSYSAIRNKALHAQWEEFDLKDVGQFIQGTKEVIETYL